MAAPIFFDASIVCAYLASASSLRGSSRNIDFDEIRKTVQKNLCHGDFSEENRTKIIDHLSHLLEIKFSSAVEEKGDEIYVRENSCIPVTKEEYPPSEMLMQDFEFKDKLGISIHGGRPNVKINNGEIIAFRSQESLFVTLTYLAAARIKGNDWLNRHQDLLDPKGHRISKIRGFFDLIDIKPVGKGIGKEMIKSDNRGNIRLALMANNLVIDKAVVNFRSRYEDRVELFSQNCENRLKEFEERKNEKAFSEFLNSLQKLRIFYLPYDCNMKLFRRAMELLLYYPDYSKYADIEKRVKRLKVKTRAYMDEHEKWFSKDDV